MQASLLLSRRYPSACGRAAACPPAWAGRSPIATRAPDSHPHERARPRSALSKWKARLLIAQRQGISRIVRASGQPALGPLAKTGYAQTLLQPFSVPGLVIGLLTGFAATMLLRRALPEHLVVQGLDGIASWVVRSGCLASFSVVAASELGDKTFFMTALLSIQTSRVASFVGSVLALGVMTCVSVGIGFLLRAVPDSIRATERLGQWAGAASLVFFGVHAITEGLRLPRGRPGAVRGARDAQLSMDEAGLDDDDEEESAAAYTRLWRGTGQVAALIFLGEWGDRSMLTTIALAAAQARPWGLLVGALAAHVATTLLAVTAGGLVAGRLDERRTSLVSGALLCGFAALSLIQ